MNNSPLTNNQAILQLYLNLLLSLPFPIDVIFNKGFKGGRKSSPFKAGRKSASNV